MIDVDLYVYLMSLLLALTWRIDNGQVRLDNSPNFDITEECCCAGCCCWADDAGAPASVTLTIDAPDCPLIDGITVTLDKSDPTPSGVCVEFSGSPASDPECSVAVGLGFKWTCEDPFSGCGDMALEMTVTASGCDSTPSNFGPYFPTGTCSCDPLDFDYTGYVLKDSAFVTDECDCCPGGFGVSISA